MLTVMENALMEELVAEPVQTWGSCRWAQCGGRNVETSGDAQ